MSRLCLSSQTTSLRPPWAFQGVHLSRLDMVSCPEDEHPPWVLSPVSNTCCELGALRYSCYRVMFHTCIFSSKSIRLFPDFFGLRVKMKTPKRKQSL